MGQSNTTTLKRIIVRKVHLLSAALVISLIVNFAPDARAGAWVDWKWDDGHQSFADLIQGALQGWEEGFEFTRETTTMYAIRGDVGNLFPHYPDCYVGDKFVDSLNNGSFNPNDSLVIGSRDARELGGVESIWDDRLKENLPYVFSLIIIDLDGALGKSGEYDYYYASFVYYPYPYGTTPSDPPIPPSDFFEDLDWLMEFAYKYNVKNITVIPEPATGVLALAGLALLARRRKR